jgi:acetyltransferase
MAEGGELAEISGETIAELNKFLPPHWSHSNPIDILGDADPERYSKAIEVVAKDPASDGLLVVMTPQGMTQPTLLAEKLKQHSKLDGKPILASWMGGTEVATGDEILTRAGIPAFPFPDTAARAFQYMWKYSENLRALYQTPSSTHSDTVDLTKAEAILARVRKSGRTLLTEYESKALMEAYGIPTVKTLVAESEDEAVRYAQDLGYPVVLKLHSEVITHKTDVGGVALNLKDEAAVRATYQRMAKIDHFLGVTVQPMVKLEGYELIIGSSVDAQFGPVLLFGSGGQLVEVYKDRALALPPLNTTLARRMMERTKIFTALKGVRGRKPVDLAALEEMMVRFSQLVSEQRWIKEIDINPLLASPGQLLALDARVVLHDPETKEEDLPKLSIRAYPAKYMSHWTMRDGSEVCIRPIRPEDEPAMVRFHEGLSEQTVYFRYFRLIKLDQRISHDRLTRICFTDYSRELVLVAEKTNAEGQSEILGVGRLTRVPRTTEAEFAVLITDRVQGQGLGCEILKRIVETAQREKITRMSGEILPENRAMQRICEKVGLNLKYDADAGVVSASFEPAVHA